MKEIDLNGKHFTKTFYIKESNVIYKNFSVSTSRHGDGIYVNKGVKNVVIDNATVYSSDYGLRTYNAPHESNSDRNSNITIQHSKIYDCNIAVYMSRYTEHSAILNNDISDINGIGLYLEHESNNILIEGNEIHRGGNHWHTRVDDIGKYGKYIAPISKLIFGHEYVPRFSWVQREAIAVDGSHHNIIRNNKISGFKGGGIYLFTNGWEFSNPKIAEEYNSEVKLRQMENFSGRPERGFKPNYSFPRLSHSDHNEIYNNEISECPVGIWVACRQSRNMDSWDYGNETPYGEKIWFWQVNTLKLVKNVFNPFFTTSVIEHWLHPGTKFKLPIRPYFCIFPDYARFNVVYGNKIIDCKFGIKNEEETSTVTNNEYEYCKYDETHDSVFRDTFDIDISKCAEKQLTLYNELYKDRLEK